MGRVFLFIALGVALGVVLGALEPRGELLAMRAELDRLREAEQDCSRSGAAAGISRLFASGPEGSERRKKGAAPKESPPAGEAAPGEPREPAQANAAAEENAPAEVDLPDEDMPVNSAAAMVDALNARAAQARAALIEQADPDEEQLAELDAAIDTMNTKLQEQVEAFVKSVEGGDEPDRREMMDFAAEALDAVIVADDAIRDTLPPEVRDSVDEEVLDPFSYIDGETVAALQALEEL